jgi:hypothetical protein
MLREGARPEVVRDILGHANIDVTQNVYGKSWWAERVDAVTQPMPLKMPRKKRKRISLNPPQQEARIIRTGCANERPSGSVRGYQVTSIPAAIS